MSLITANSTVSYEQPLIYRTPQKWAEFVVTDLPTLLCDHAHCERKAAAFALGLLQRYGADNPFVKDLSKLAREEMRHFELVVDALLHRGHQFLPLKPGGYAASLRSQLAEQEPKRLFDHLIVAGLIEARSCERFQVLAIAVALIDQQLANFYQKLYHAEKRHFQLYFNMARTLCPDVDFISGLQQWSEHESKFLNQKRLLVRIHSPWHDANQII